MRSLLLLVPLAALCGDGSLALKQRIGGRVFPSVFQAWSPADNLAGEDRWYTLARHDLVFGGPEMFGLRWNGSPSGLAEGFTPESIALALERRRLLLARNPRLVLLAEVRYRDASRRYLPPDHRWWKRDASGKLETGWEEGGFPKLDYESAELQGHVARQAAAAVRSGVVDGVMLDWWKDDDAHVALARLVRKAIGRRPLLMVNANDRIAPRSAPYVNGFFMECYRSRNAADWERIRTTLEWAEAHLRKPRVNCLETWYEKSRGDLHRMRATTTLALTRSDGYALFSDPNPLPTPDHLHDWHSFWEKSLGRPKGKGKRAGDGTYWREFQHGVAVYNPPGNPPAAVRLRGPYRSLATGRTGPEHAVAPLDGDILIRAR